MADFISREAAINTQERRCLGCPCDRRLCYKCAVTTTTKQLLELPAADVRPVVHGTWIDKCVRDWHCSVCDYGIQKIRVHDGYCYKDLPNFCPNCGADMREDGTDG